MRESLPCVKGGGPEGDTVDIYDFEFEYQK